MNGPTIAVLAIIVVAVILAAVRIKKKGSCSCGGGDKGGCSSCHCSSNKK